MTPDERMDAILNEARRARAERDRLRDTLAAVSDLVSRWPLRMEADAPGLRAAVLDVLRESRQSETKANATEER